MIDKFNQYVNKHTICPYCLNNYLDSIKYGSITEALVLRRSKIDAFQNLMNHRENRLSVKNTLGQDMDWQFENANKAIEWRKIIATNDDFTVEEYRATLLFVEMFNKEEYEKLTNIIIDENK